MSEPKTTPRCLLDAINDENCEAGTVEQLRREHAVCRLGVEDPILAQSAGLHLKLQRGGEMYDNGTTDIYEVWMELRDVAGKVMTADDGRPLARTMSKLSFDPDAKRTDLIATGFTQLEAIT